MNLTISHLLEAYRNKTLHPEQLVDDILASCKQFEHHNIWISLLSKQQIQPYLDALESRDIGKLPLYGIPFAIKDNIDLAGIPTTAACPAYRYVPDESAFVVRQLIDAGAIPIGKTNMDQFATGLVGTRSPEPWGPCKNAFDPEYISGGSSSGSAVAVALGLVSFSLGTDTAGSGRVPAAFNNIIGLKPTRGLLSTRGVVPACRSLDCVSIFALNSDDADAVLEQATTYDAEDAYSRANRFDNNTRHYGRVDKPFTFAVPKPEQLEFFGNDSTQRLFAESVHQLRKLGGVMQEIDFAPFLNAARLLYEGPWVAERYVAIEDMMTHHADELLPVIRTIIGSAEGKSAMDAFKAEYALQAYRKQIQAQLDAVDLLVTPTAGTIYTIDEVNAEPIRLNSNLGYYTNYMNLADCTSIAVPAGFLDNGLPFGITFISNAMSDRKLLSFANSWQQHLSLPLGKTDLPFEQTNGASIETSACIPVVVCGAHLHELPLNWQLTERGARLLETTQTAAAYRMYALSGGPPYRPGLIRDDAQGAAIEIEIWDVPREHFGSFVAGIPAPLGIGKVETRDGRWLPGFICEGYGIEGAREITELGGWRAYLSTIIESD